MAYKLRVPLEKVAVLPTETAKMATFGCTGGSATSESSVQAALFACDELLTRLAPFMKPGADGRPGRGRRGHLSRGPALFYSGALCSTGGPRGSDTPTAPRPGKPKAFHDGARGRDGVIKHPSRVPLDDQFPQSDLTAPPLEPQYDARCDFAPFRLTVSHLLLTFVLTFPSHFVHF